jgi:tetratricopeptide (TPR) repeat protein
MSAEDYKARGNEAYHAKNFSEAVKWYSEAIAAEPRNAIFWNNRAAAYLELKKYEEAANDAEKSAILSPTAKANARHGRALWFLNRRAEAVAAYERAQRLDPSIIEYSEAIRSLQNGGRYPQASSSSPRPAAAAPDRVALMLDAVIISTAVVYLVLLFLWPAMGQRAWQLACLSMIARQLRSLTVATAPEQLRSVGFWKDFVLQRAIKEFTGQYLFLCTVLLLTSAPAIQFLFAAMALYAAVDISVDHRQAFEAAIQATPLASMLLPRLEQVRSNVQQLYLQAGACEAITLFMLPVLGSPLLATLCILLFVKWRYQHDRWSRMAWHGLYVQIGGFTRHPRVPAVLARIFEACAGLLHRAAA